MGQNGTGEKGNGAEWDRRPAPIVGQLTVGENGAGGGCCTTDAVYFAISYEKNLFC